MSRFLSLLVTLLLSGAVAASSVQAQSEPPKGTSATPPQVWAPYVSETKQDETNPCIKKCNTEFEKELESCFALVGQERVDCEQALRERHKACYTGCPK